MKNAKCKMQNEKANDRPSFVIRHSSSLLGMGAFVWLVLIIALFMSQPYVAQVVNAIMQLIVAGGSGQ